VRKIAVFTGTRAEYGLLYWLMHAIKHDDELTLQVIVSGAHLSAHHGNTWQAIVADGFNIDARVEMLLASDSASSIVKSMGIALIGFADALAQLKPDVLVVLGDRTEALAIAQAALIMNIPLVHLHGGELSQGAYDDAVRHAITKMASLHFVATETYRRRVIQLGEDPSTVFNVGATGLEHVTRTKRHTFDELINHLQIPLQKPYFLVTYHPVTLLEKASKEGLVSLLQVLDDYKDYHVLFTYPNADNGGHEIILQLEQYCKGSSRAFIFNSLGFQNYLTAVAHAALVVGNSSSGIIEVPSFKVPTINIGRRQQGRLAADSIIHSSDQYDALKEAFQKGLSPAFGEICERTINPYGDGCVSSRILSILKKHQFSKTKPFKDMEFINETT